MAHIIIDAYNLMWSSSAFKRYQNFSLEKQRDILIEQLSAYKKIKPHQITVVFDGTKSGHYSLSEYQQAGIQVYFSRHHQTADQLLIEMIQDSSKEMIVVSSDHQITTKAKSKNYPFISSQEFAQKIQTAMMDSMKGFIDEDLPEKKPIHKRWITKKRGPAKRLPKSKRRAKKRLDEI